MTVPCRTLITEICTEHKVVSVPQQLSLRFKYPEQISLEQHKIICFPTLPSFYQHYLEEALYNVASHYLLKKVFGVLYAICIIYILLECPRIKCCRL